MRFQLDAPLRCAPLKRGVRRIDMDPETRRKLKKAGKAEIERQSSELHAQLEESNPADIGDPQWAANYREVTLKEKEYKKNRSRVYPASEVGVELLLNPVNIDWSRGYLPVQGYYLQCKSCGDLVPMNPVVKLTCSCEAIAISSNIGEISFEPHMVVATKLIAKASHGQTKQKKWWQFW